VVKQNRLLWPIFGNFLFKVMGKKIL